MRKAAMAAGRGLLDLLAPTSCVFCAEPGARLCRRCWRVLPYAGSACRRCAEPFTGALPASGVCSRCELDPPTFSATRAAFRYDFPVDRAIRAVKFRHQLFYLPVLARRMASIVTRHFGECDVLVPVPLHRIRQTLRGFNQAELLAAAVAKRAAMPIARGVCRNRPTQPQSGLTAEARRMNVRNVFTLTQSLQWRHPLIIDDVMTTGHTCDELAAVLLHGGAQDVSVVVAARAPSPTGRKPLR
jgi:ComF family protein